MSLRGERPVINSTTENRCSVAVASVYTGSAEKVNYMTQLAIDAEGLTKIFNGTAAVDNIDLSIPRGGIHGFLGPNGAGKTTTIRMLATLLQPDAGRAQVLGHDLETEADAVRSKIGLTGQFASVDEDLTGIENLRVICQLLGFSRSGARDRAQQLLTALGLHDAGGLQVKKYSGGMRRRLDIAASIAVTPELLFLDEPTTGLDPRSRNQVWDIVRAMVDVGTTILLTTQYLDEADHLADRISVIDEGRIIAEGTSSELKASVGSSSLHLRVEDASLRAQARQMLEAGLGVPFFEEHDSSALSATVSATHAVAPAIVALQNAGIAVAQYSVGQPTLDEVFLTLTGKGVAPDSPTKNETAGVT